MSTHKMGFSEDLTTLNNVSVIISSVVTLTLYEPRREKNRLFTYAKTKTQISFAVTAKLISDYAFAAWIVQSLFYLNPKFQASSYLLWLYSLVCVGPGQKPRRPVFSELGSYHWDYRHLIIITITRLCNRLCIKVAKSTMCN